MAKTTEVTKSWKFIGYKIPSRRVADKLRQATNGDTINKNLIRQITGSHDVLFVDNVAREITFWKISGINCISSDSCFQLIEEEAVANYGFSQEYLQKITGHLLPIHVDLDKHTIDFMNF